jgi:hypothetical protein
MSNLKNLILAGAASFPLLAGAALAQPAQPTTQAAPAVTAPATAAPAAKVEPGKTSVDTKASTDTKAKADVKPVDKKAGEKSSSLEHGKTHKAVAKKAPTAKAGGKTVAPTTTQTAKKPVETTTEPAKKL